MEVADAKRLKTLETKNAKLKKMLAEQMMDVTTLNEMLKEPRRPNSGRKAVDWTRKDKSYLHRQVCALAGIGPRVFRQTSKRPADTKLRDRIKELASGRRRFGYRRLHILLRRDGWEVNWK